ncbi:MAG TPA: HisA/HisF-related TIM barrel protein [Burkholderiales bacterium]|nr:HisA/HisF-related TIM barrel protein [Burkholderiales bacterium]
MKIIPVLDLMHGQVVHAIGGERNQYRPIESELCAGSDALDIIDALLDLYPFNLIYIADIDAIQKNGSNIAVMEKLHGHFPRLELWVDSGISDISGYTAWQELKIGHAVIGSESLPDAALLSAVCKSDCAPYLLLSLDFKGERFCGERHLLNHAELWPEHVIIMTLTRVGCLQGPDLNQFGAIRRHTPHKKLYAAGGVRDIDDLDRLARAGADGALLASALHQRRISASDLAALASGDDETNAQ